MKKIKTQVDNSFIIEKSKFITTLYKVQSVEEINDLLAKTRKKYYDATHNCYAYILDNGNIQKCSDDGEPSKTAGFPMLEVLKKNDVTDVLAITTRYFGGIKLGAGGLIRAYSGSVSEAIKLAQFVETKELTIYKVEISYSDYNNAIDFWSSLKIKDITYSDKIILKIAFYNEEIEDSLDKIKNLTFGKALISYLNQEFLDVDIL